MEYLMTYGWAILIIAVVLAALFELGVFNANNLGPRAQPGSCQVLRPDGPGTTAFINTEGLCNGELPQYMPIFSQSPAGYITANVAGSNSGEITVAFWIDPVNNGYWGSSGNYWEGAVSGGGSSTGCNPGGQFYFYIEAGSNPPVESFSITGARDFPGKTLVPNTWQQLVGTFNGSYIDVYWDGQLVGSPVATLGNTVSTYPIVTISGTNPTSAGGGCNPISGYMANVQIYNTSLSANDIHVLNLEGIGGAPIDLQNLVGWWPLNGNAQDYSGNNNNGQINGVTFTGSWTSGYTAP